MTQRKILEVKVQVSTHGNKVAVSAKTAEGITPDAVYAAAELALAAAARRKPSTEAK